MPMLASAIGAHRPERSPAPHARTRDRRGGGPRRWLPSATPTARRPKRRAGRGQAAAATRLSYRVTA